MATATIVQAKFPQGTVIGAYTPTNNRRIPPAVAAVNEQTVDANSSVTFTGLSLQSYDVTDKPLSQVWTLTVDATAGTLRYRYGGVTTLDQAYNVTAGNLQTALEGLFGSGNVAVTGGPGDSGGTTPYTITLQGTLANTTPGTFDKLAGATALSGGGATSTLVSATGGRPGGSRFIKILGV